MSAAWLNSTNQQCSKSAFWEYLHKQILAQRRKSRRGHLNHAHIRKSKLKTVRDGYVVTHEAKLCFHLCVSTRITVTVPWHRVCCQQGSVNEHPRTGTPPEIRSNTVRSDFSIYQAMQILSDIKPANDFLTAAPRRLKMTSNSSQPSSTSPLRWLLQVAISEVMRCSWPLTQVWAITSALSYLL